ncbi:hypothetical protein H0H87_001234 [Tephrocybe sp. NHM501043]|nr:hypothetical protein H0H87_001234 [Tephrocybe sp. NHM501043]
MKRGFLKTKTTRSDPVAVNTVEASKDIEEPVKIPIAPTKEPEVPSLGKISQSFNFVVTTLRNGPRSSPTICLFYPGTKEAVTERLKGCGFHPELDTVDGTIDTVIKNALGQGRGIFAGKDFHPGDHIYSERPIIVIPEVIVEGPVKRGLDFYLELLVSRLSPTARSEFLGLHNCKSGDPQDLVGIFNTNSLDIGRLPGEYDGMYAGICIYLSHFNHSCSPNALHRWDQDTFAFYVTASRPIAAGEQIFIGYCGNSPRAERQRQMSEKYAFACTCTSCILPKDLSARSDIRRKIIDSANQALAKQHQHHERDLKIWAANPSLPDDHILKPARFIMQLLEEEPFIDFEETLWLSMAEVACKALCALSDRPGTVELAQKASAYAKIVKYKDDAGWGKVVAAPEKTVWWGVRTKLAN